MGSLFIRAGNRVFRRIREMDVTTIAVMSGHAIGGGRGLELALVCNFRYAVEGIKLGLPETSRGAIPGWLGVQRLYALAVAGRMHHLVMLGETITTQPALEWGIVQAVVAGAQLDAYVRKIGARLSSRSPAVRAVGKRVMRMIEPTALDVTHELAASVCKGTADVREGVAAFREKRPADFGRDRELSPSSRTIPRRITPCKQRKAARAGGLWPLTRSVVKRRMGYLTAILYECNNNEKRFKALSVAYLRPTLCCHHHQLP